MPVSQPSCWLTTMLKKIIAIMADNNKPTTEEVLAEAMATITAQGEKIAELEAAITPTKPAEKVVYETPKQAFTVAGTKYKFNAPRYIDNHGNTVLAVDALKNAAELERLATIKSGILTEVKK